MAERTSRILVCSAGQLSALGYLYLACQSSGYGVATLAQMLWVCGLGASLALGVFYAHCRLGLRLNWWDIFVFAVLFRLLGLFAYPVLEDDFFRYLWDGWHTVTYGSPYGVAPAEYFAVELSDRWSDILDGINYPEVATVYGPTAQALFALSYLIAPGEVWPLQGLVALADLAVLLVLKRLAPLRWVLLYAWSPLLIKEFAFTAHVDVVGACFLMAALWLRWRESADMRSWSISLGVGILLALACGIKVFALLAVPFLLQSDWRGWLAFVGGALLLALPFGLVDAWWPAGLQAMGGNWLFNAPLYFAASAVWGWSSLGWVKWILGTLFALACAGVCLHVLRPAYWPLLLGFRGGIRSRLSSLQLVHPQVYLPSLTLLFGGLMFILPVLNPWYLAWWLPFAVLRPSYTAWTCSLVVLLSYVAGINLGGSDLDLYEQPAWVLWLEFMPVAAALICDLVRYRRAGQPV